MMPILMPIALAWRLAFGWAQATPPSTAWNAAAIKATVEQVAVIVEGEYMDGDMATRAADDLRRRLALSEYPATLTEEDLATRLTRDLFAITKDKHIAVSRIRPADPAGSTESDASRSRAEHVRRTNGGIQRVEILAGNVGYLNLTSFWRLEEARAPITAAMQLLRGADALIFDMRGNTGGSPDTAALILSYLFDQPGIELFQVIPRDGTPIRYDTQELPEADRNGSRPVFVLTAARTFSAGEGFAYLLQDRKRGQVVGERTAGAANPGRPYPVNDRFEVTVPNGRVRGAVGGGNWEGTGVIPDVPVAEANALRTAHALAIRRLAADAKGAWQVKLLDVLKMLERR